MTQNETIFPKSFVLRITREEWFRRVFTMKKYYPGVRRRWEPDGVILLVRKTEKGDSFIGYGVVGEFTNRDQLPEEKRQECTKMGWKGEIVFKELFKFDPPLPIKETILGGSKIKGRFFQGYPLKIEQVKSILDVAKERVAFLRTDPET